MVFPFDFDRSDQYKLNHASDSFDQCAQRGFVCKKSDIAWRGTTGTSDPLTTDRTVKTSSEVDAVDDLGRITRVIDDGDLVRADDETVPGTPNYTREQWNGGDALAALGVSQLGAHIYDPVIGRFMSRDPLIIPRTAATTNPYAFANNDPVNLSDPTGLRPEWDENGNDHGISESC